MDITNVVEAIITLAVALITTFLIPWLKANIDAKQMSKMLTWVKIAVQAAEMIYTESGMGEQKKAYVESFLTEKGLKLSADELDNLIESAVLELKAEVAA